MKTGTFAILAFLPLVIACGDATAEAGESEAVAATQAGPATTPLRGPDLSDFLDFNDPGGCNWNTRALETARGSWEWGEGDENVPSTHPMEEAEGGEVSARLDYEPFPDQPDVWRADVDFEGVWNGLQVVGIRTDYYPDNSELAGSIMAIRFAEPISVVAPKLADLGFPIGADGKGSVRATESEKGFAARIVTDMKREGDETLFACNFVFDDPNAWRYM